MARSTYIIPSTVNQMTSDLYEDMSKLNALYEELMWDNKDELEFTADYSNDRIIIYNKTRLGDNLFIEIHDG